MTLRRMRVILNSLMAIGVSILTGCGGSGGQNAASSYTVGGTINGLGGATGLVLANGTDTFNVPSNTTNFTIPTMVTNGQSYDLTVKVHPTAMQCSVSSGAGTIAGENVTNISVSCGIGTESLVHSFVGGTTDGSDPLGVIQAMDGSLNGVTNGGGVNGRGVLFNISPDGATETVLYAFPTPDGVPNGNIIQATDGNFYGVGFDNGTAAHVGTVYRINPAGTSEATLYSFAGGTLDGAYPQGNLVESSDGNLFGHTAQGGRSNDGVIFEITPSGSETVLYSFAGGPTDGAYPESLIQGSDGNLYGLTTYSGVVSTQCGADTLSTSIGNGVLFKITPSGAETVLHFFTGGTMDGCEPSVLIQASDDNFYGVTYGGGASNDGVIFKMTPSGTETVLYSFSGGTMDGENPDSLMQASDGNLYGTTYIGGISSNTCGGPKGDGVLFKLTMSGVESILHFFSGGTTDGCQPSGLIQAENGNLYGITSFGGTGGLANDGTIWEFN